MAEWFARAFGVAASEARTAIADARSKLIDEAWFGRKTPEPHRGHDLGWSLPDRDKGNAPDLQSQEPAKAERGIDR